MIHCVIDCLIYNTISKAPGVALLFCKKASQIWDVYGTLLAILAVL